jgi:hypothetical protein
MGIKLCNKMESKVFPPDLPKEDNPTLLTKSLSKNGYFSVPFQIIYSFVIGLVLSPFSFGFIFFILSSGINEFWYAYRISGKYNNYHLFYRFGIFCVGLLGFLVGRTIICKDRYPFRGIYDESICSEQIHKDYKKIRKKYRK